MALRTKTIEYAFPADETTRAAGARFDFAAITLDIPENTSRTFKSVIVELHTIDNSATVASLTSWLIGIKLGAVAFNDATVTVTIANSGEHQSLWLTRDVTSYFVTNFGSGTSQTCQVGFSMAVLPRINTCAKLIITYEYDDAATTRVKTVKIPIESGTGGLTTSLVELGTNQVPLLNTFCPESTKVFKNIWFEVQGNEYMNAAATADWQLNLALDAEAADPDGLHFADLISSRYYHYFWVRNTMATNVVHALKASTTTALSTHAHLAIVLCVTYTYDHAASTTILNSIQIPMNRVSDNSFLGETAANNCRVDAEFYVEEPATIALVQSGVLHSFIEVGSNIPQNVRAGAQAYLAYTSGAAATNCGMGCLMHRIDSGGASGAGLTLARGKNTFTFDFYHTTGASSMHGFLGSVLFLNYTSGKHANGDGVHNHTVTFSIMTTDVFTVRRFSASVAPDISEVDYWINSIGLYQPALRTITNSADSVVGNLSFELAAGEWQGDGFMHVDKTTTTGTGELFLYNSITDATPFFDVHPDYIRPRANVMTARRWFAFNHQATYQAVVMTVTYHSILFNVAGNVSGSAGGTVTMGLHRASDGELLKTTTRAGDGAYTITWYDNTENLYVEASEDATHLGRSETGPAV